MRFAKLATAALVADFAVGFFLGWSECLHWTRNR